MHRLPSERSDPLGVTAKSLADSLARLGIPQPDLKARCREGSAGALALVEHAKALPCCPCCPSQRSSRVHPTRRRAASQCGPSRSTRASRCRGSTGGRCCRPIRWREDVRLGRRKRRGWARRVLTRGGGAPRVSDCIALDPRLGRVLTIDTTTTPGDLPDAEHGLGLALDDKDVFGAHDARMLQEQVCVNRVVDGDARVLVR